MNSISQSFELRYFSQNTKANGETDFKGDTSTLDTEQRVSFLEEYARQMEKDNKQIDLDQLIVTKEEVELVMNTLKKQPLPGDRKRIVLDEWKWIGDEANQKVETFEKRLYFLEDATLTIPILTQDWRCFFEWKITRDSNYENSAFSIGEVVTLGFDHEKRLYYITDGKTTVSSQIEGDVCIKVELDFINSKYNVYVNQKVVADFVPFSIMNRKSVDTIILTARMGMKIEYIWGQGYKKLEENEFEPFLVQTCIDLSIQEKVSAKGWKREDYDDVQWKKGILPIVYGGERYAGQDLLLRKKVNIQKVPPYAEFYIESITPGGEIYINGKLAELIKDENMHKIDVTSYLREGDNLFAIRVNADQIKDENKMTHTHTDVYTGWFAARMHLDLLPSVYIEDVFTWTDSVHTYSAIQKIQVSVKAQKGLSSSKATLFRVKAKLFPWYPEEGKVCGIGEWNTFTYPNAVERTEGIIEVSSPRLWSSKEPNLYKLVVELYHRDGIKCDEFVVTTGIRTVSQEGGVFRINGKPELLRAPLLFGARPPMETIATNEKCPPTQYYTEEMLMVQKMNGNGLRMSVHDEKIGGINDPRICEIADQLGIMLVWQTNPWLRLTAPTNLDLKALATCIKQVRNHCSIIIWQPSNHPSWKNWNSSMKMYRSIYDTIVPLDQSRLISPSADSRRLNPYYDDGKFDYEGNPVDTCDPIWTAPLICRGNMDYILGYGNEWSALRQWPKVEEKNLPAYMDSTSYIQSFIESPYRAYFNFEHDETAGQPNWEIHKGKPTYRLQSYEWRYDEGSIGRTLDFSEWKTSQAWQAFEAYEVIRKSRWLDYDGFSWCCLRGGANSATYQKPLVDYYGQAKLVYYAHQMVFQDVLAGSGNVDIVYGPKDSIPVVVLNLGTEKNVDVALEVVSTEGKIIEKKIYSNIMLTAGRSSTHLEAYQPPAGLEGIYVVRYNVYERESIY